MKIKNPLYHCCNCKKIVDDLDSLYFVEEGSPKGFCSEDCIEKYYLPIVQFYEGEVESYRSSNELETEDCLSFVGEPTFMEKLLSRPSEIWRQENDLKEEVYCFISENSDSMGEKFYLMAICSVFNNRPAFIFAATATKSLELLDEMRIGEQVENPEEFIASAEETEMTNEPSIDKDTMQDLENKKSTYLAQLLVERKETDIPFEQFMLFDQYLEETLEGPDELYKFVDDDGDTIYSYMKAHDREGISFFYFVLCMGFPNLTSNSGEAVLPIVSFPTLDGELSQSYRKGELLSGELKS